MSTTANEEYEALLQFLYIAPIGLVQARMDGEILMINPLCAQLMMPLVRDGELINLFTALGGVAPDLRHRAQSFTDGYGMVCDAVHLHVNTPQPGRKTVQTLSLTLLKLDSERLMAVLSDVTESVKRDRELRHSQAWLQTLVTGLTDYAFESLDHEGCLQSWNPSIARITGFDSAASLGRSFSIFYPGDYLSSERARDRLEEADRSGWSIDEGWMVRADGSRFWGSCLIAPLHAPEEAQSDERAYSLIVRDVSDRREATEALRRSVSCDHLTGLINRRAFFEAAQLEMERWARAPRPLSVVLIDADHFKQVNDAHGHAAGDAVLRHLAAGLSANFRAVDLVARIGGEEFVALLPGASAEEAEAVARRLCLTIAAQPAMFDGQPIACTVSAGVASMEGSVEGVAALLQRADAAMYAAKAQGRNRVLRWHAGLHSESTAAALPTPTPLH